MSWVFKRTEPGLWTSGYYDPDGRFEPQADHESPGEAADHVAYLNGSSVLGWSSLGAEQRTQLVDALADELARRAIATPPPAAVAAAPPADPDQFTAAEVAASLRRLADLFERDADFAQLAREHYFLSDYRRKPDKLLLSVSGPDPREAMRTAALAACAAGIEVTEYRSEDHPGIFLKFGTFDVQIYTTRAQLAAAAAGDQIDESSVSESSGGPEAGR